jgi:AhpD family alkylhydroperoxidase
MRTIIRNAAAVAALAVVGLASVPALSIDYPNIDTFWNIQKHLGVVPKFFKLFPEGRLPAMWTDYKNVHLNPDTALDAKTKRLIALAVAAEAECASCLYLQTSAAFANGASFQEVQEAVAIFAIEHDWSEILAGDNSDAEAGFNRGEAPVDGHGFPACYQPSVGNVAGQKTNAIVLSHDVGGYRKSGAFDNGRTKTGCGKSSRSRGTGD